MAELIACPKCRQQLQVPTQYLGETVQCPECQHQFTATTPAISTKPTAPAIAESGRTRAREPFDEDDDNDDFDDIRRRRVNDPLSDGPSCEERLKADGERTRRRVDEDVAHRGLIGERRDTGRGRHALDATETAGDERAAATGNRPRS